EKNNLLTLTESTGRGEKLSITLPDGSQAFLNSVSKITYPKNFTGTTREVKIEGEVYFNVTHDAGKPFVVQAQNSKTRVLGTTFNVKSIPGKETTVTLVTGKVNVSVAGGDSSILHPNQ